MAISFGVKELTLAGGTTLRPPRDGMTVFFGPNNSGKSVLLREVGTRLSGAIDSTPRWVTNLERFQSGSGEDLVRWLDDNGHAATPHPQGGSVLYSLGLRGRTQTTKDALTAAWENGQYSGFGGLLMTQEFTETRLENRTASTNWDRDQPPSDAVQVIVESRSLQDRLSDLMHRAFKVPIALNREGANFTLRIGKIDLPEGEHPLSPEVRRAYSLLPEVREQGDGLRSFTNLLLATMLRPTPVIVIDEPEAFLHPPQARLLGRILAEETPSPCQVFVATHSVDFLAGVLEADSKPVSLVRLDRSTGTPQPRVLPEEELQAILNTPLLRYSNIISGLFHDAVVLCEGAGDAQFYAATFDVIRGSDPHNNIVFLHTGGKEPLADAARRLRQCGIPVAVVTDLDLFNSEYHTRRAFENLGEQWDPAAASDFSLLTKATAGKAPLPTRDAFLQDLSATLVNLGDAEQLTAFHVEKIKALLKVPTGWRTLKKSGVDNLDHDGPLANPAAYEATQRLLARAAAIGLFPMPDGELESWVPAIPRKEKAEWHRQVFAENGPYKHPSGDLRRFCTQITDYLFPQ
ncbi:ATP-dependent nuclease [Streptomyces xanthophaeus]